MVAEPVEANCRSVLRMISGEGRSIPRARPRGGRKNLLWVRTNPYLLFERGRFGRFPKETDNPFATQIAFKGNPVKLTT